MPELIPSQRIAVELRPGWVVPAWAMFYNPATDRVEYEWVSPLGVRQTGWTAASTLAAPGLQLGPPEELREAG